MACYYLVISSTHLSNGHFRSIKGVFRGPLRKNGANLPGYAEKGKSIANALEDLKANFYCELCDKQYHKHQEFDNHINSYDHAHKQRLKELKQREYARNVASKSWKDEKKQEKALKRLHELAELRKQTHCTVDDGPLFKAPRFKGPREEAAASKDDRKSSSNGVVTTCRDTMVSILEEPDLGDQEAVKKISCCIKGSKSQQSTGGSLHSRAGVSFCFSRKALPKLDSSASVFNESTEEANECGQFLHYKEKQTSVSLRHYAHISETVAENSDSSPQDETRASLADNTSENAENFQDDKGSQENTKEQSEIAQSNIAVEMQSQDTTCTDQLSPKEVNVTSETELTSHVSDEACCQAESLVKETCSSKHTVADAILIEHLSNLLSQKNGEVEGSCDLNEANSTASNGTAENSTESPEQTLDESSNTNTPAKPLSFLSVLSKDGNTILQWPTELVLYTKTQPSISYACNPLYFDFKCSRKNNIRKSNEQIKGQKQSCSSRTDYDVGTSGNNKDKVTDSQNDFRFPKKDALESVADKEMGFLEKSAHKGKFGHIQEYRAQVSSDFLQNCSWKQRRPPYVQPENIKTPNYNRDRKSTSSERERKRKWFVHEDQLASTNKRYSSDRSKRRKQRNHHDGWENSDCSKDSESDSNSSISTKSSFSQMSSSSSSTRNGLNCRTSESALGRVKVVGSKHNDDHSSKSGRHSDFRDILKCGCKNEKHKTLHHVCSRHANNRSSPQKTHDDVETNSTMDTSKTTQEINEVSLFEGLENHMCSRLANDGHSSQKTHNGLEKNVIVDRQNSVREMKDVLTYGGLENHGCSRLANNGLSSQKTHDGLDKNVTVDRQSSVQEIKDVSTYGGLENHVCSRHTKNGPQKTCDDLETNPTLYRPSSIQEIKNTSKYEGLENQACSRLASNEHSFRNDSETNTTVDRPSSVWELNDISTYTGLENHVCSRQVNNGHSPLKTHDNQETNPTVHRQGSVQDINMLTYEGLENLACSRHANNGPQKTHGPETNVAVDISHSVHNISRCKGLEKHVCSEHASNGHICQKFYDDLEMNPTLDSSLPVTGSRDTTCNTADSRVGHSSASPEGIMHPSPSLKSVDNNDRKGCLYESPYPNIPLPINSGNNVSEDIVQHTVARRKLLSQFFSENGAYLTQIKENHLKNNSHHFDMSSAPVDPQKSALPLPDSINIGFNSAKDLVVESSSDRTPLKNSQNNKVTLAANGYGCHVDSKEPIATECRSIPLLEAPGQFMSQFPSFMQSPDPVHLNFSLGMPSLRYQGGIDSPNTKEELSRMGHPNINMRLGPIDGNLKYCYESTMQDFRRMDNNRRLYHKSSPPPPLTQRPLLFSPDEVDKYKSLQFQAQQHMQKQLLTKPFKALPANSSPVLSTAQTVQPLPVQHHPSFTTIHHAFMQRYAVTASMHSHIGHFPFPHLNPLPQSQFAPINLSSLTPTLLPTPPPLAAHPLPHPLHLVPAAAIHPAHLTIQAIPHATLIPALLTPHPNAPPTLQLHPFIHPLFQGQDIHHHSHHSGPSHPH